MLCFTRFLLAFLFQAYNEQEAHLENILLTLADARLCQSLNQVLNPWGSLILRSEPNKLFWFYDFIQPTVSFLENLLDSEMKPHFFYSIFLSHA